MVSMERAKGVRFGYPELGHTCRRSQRAGTYGSGSWSASRWASPHMAFGASLSCINCPQVHSDFHPMGDISTVEALGS